MTENPDILHDLAGRRDRWARRARSSSGSRRRPTRILQAARAKLARKGCDLLVVNPVGNGRGFGRADNEAIVYGADGSQAPIPRGSKEALAEVVWDLDAARLKRRRARG